MADNLLTIQNDREIKSNFQNNRNNSNNIIKLQKKDDKTLTSSLHPKNDEINTDYNTYPLISIVVINFNGKKYLEETIPAIFELNYPNYEILLVDNGSTDGSIEFVKKLDGIKYIKSERIGEKNYACNLGISKSKGEYILLMDNDLILVEKDILKNLLNETNHLPDCGSIGLAYVNRNTNRTEGYGCYLSLYYSWEKPNIAIDEVKQMHGRPVGNPNGAGIFIKKELWNYVGGYDDHLQFGGDDDDLGMRLWMFGYSNYLYSNSLQIHIGMAERTDTVKYATKFQKKVYAHMYTIVKNFSLINAIITINGYIIFSSAKAFKQSIKRKSIKPLTSTAHGYYTFITNIPTALRKRKDLQKERLVKDDIFLKIRPSFTEKHSRFNAFMKVFK